MGSFQIGRLGKQHLKQLINCSIKVGPGSLSGQETKESTSRAWAAKENST